MSGRPLTKSDEAAAERSKRQTIVKLTPVPVPERSDDRADIPAIEGLLTPTQVAKALAISKRTLWGLTKSGAIKSVKLGPQAIRYVTDDVREFVQSRRAQHGEHKATA